MSRSAWMFVLLVVVVAVVAWLAYTRTHGSHASISVAAKQHARAA
jgi:hypothetical protein